MGHENIFNSIIECTLNAKGQETIILDRPVRKSLSVEVNLEKSSDKAWSK